MKISGYKEKTKNTLRAFFTLELDSGLHLNGCTLHQKGDKRWVGLPARPYTDKAGNQTWAKVVDIPDKDRWAAFQHQALKAVDACRPAPEVETQHEYPF